MQRLLLQAQTALAPTPTRRGRPQGWPAFADRLLELARGAEPGSDHQLAFVNALCRRCCRCGTRRRAGGAAGHDPADVGLPGLVVDTDLRWRLVTALAAAATRRRRTSTTPSSTPRRERDPTAAGKRKAAAARRPGRRPRSRKRRGSRSSRTTRCPTSPPARSSAASRTRPGGAAGAVHARSTSTRSPTCGSGGPASSRRPWSIGLYPSWDVSQDGRRRRRASSPATCRPPCAGW